MCARERERETSRDSQAATGDEVAIKEQIITEEKHPYIRQLWDVWFGVSACIFLYCPVLCCLESSST
jgi:hypothetical protein